MNDKSEEIPQTILDEERISAEVAALTKALSAESAPDVTRLMQLDEDIPEPLRMHYHLLSLHERLDRAKVALYQQYSWWARAPTFLTGLILGWLAGQHLYF